jgi:RNA polymerase sigma-70 factor (ECF subfamily)
MVLAAGRPEAPDALQALTRLCETYWYPLYAYARRRGRSEEDARDLTQGFFAELLAKRWVEAADPARGRFRAFLLTAFKRYAGHERDRARAAKRGGGKVPLSIDFEDGERRYSREPAHGETAERIYDRRWALTLLARVLDGLRREMEDEGRGEVFDALKPAIGGSGGMPAYRVVAERLGMTEGGVKVAVHRLRTRYRERLRAEIADTVASPEDVDEEIRDLLAALTNWGQALRRHRQGE